MRIVSTYRCRSKSAILMKIILSLTSIYSIFLLLQIVHEFIGITPNTQEGLLVSDSNLHERKSSLQLTWWKRNKDEFNNNVNQKIRQQITESFIHKDEKTIDVNKKPNTSIIGSQNELEKLRSIIADDNVLSRIDKRTDQVIKYYTRKDLLDRKEEIKMKRKKYIFTFRYYEQLAMATNNLIALASLAKHYDRKIVMPFVNNSRMNGVPFQISRQRRTKIFANMSSYFDIVRVNATLKERGYSTLAHFSDFIFDCKNRIDIVLHFMFADKSSAQDVKKWFGIEQKTWKSLRLKAARNGGWTTCDFLRHSGMEDLIGAARARQYVCVDPEIIKSPDDLERLVLKSASCVTIFHWKGTGKNRTHFPLPDSVLEPVRPSDLLHNSKLVDIARDFVKKHLKRPFLGIHVRAERHLVWKGFDQLLRCIKKLVKKVFESKEHYGAKELFIATDLPSYGSDTIQKSKSRDRILANRYLTDALKHPVVFNPDLYHIYDRGQVAIIEMHILSLGVSLHTLGGGNFHDWIVDLFLLRNVEDRSLVHKICLLR